MPSTRTLLHLACLAILSVPGAAAQGLNFATDLGPLRAPSPTSAPACDAPTAPLDLALWRTLVTPGQRDLTCQNTFVDFQHTPRSEAVPRDSFDIFADQVREAKAEVLISAMDYMSFTGHPGHRINLGIRDLYLKVKANPVAYPEGMRIKVMTGGLPFWKEEVGTRDFVQDLLELGVPLNDPALNWNVQAADYRFFPHSHVKLFVVDGLDVMTGGFSVADYHQTKDLPGGHALVDLALRMRGPVAQEGVAVFDDLWENSQQLYCPLDVKPTEMKRCTLGDPQPIQHPLPAREARPEGTSRAYVLYRRSGYTVSEQAMLALIGAASKQIDLFETDFGPGLPCILAYMTPGDCTASNSAPYLKALVDAMKRGVKVRAIMVNYAEGAQLNRSGVALMRMEAKKLGLSNLFEARYFNGPMHAKAFTVDAGAPSGGMVVTGSTNFHFSAWGPFKLAEADLATSDPQAVAEQQAYFQRTWDTNSLPVPVEPWLADVQPPQALSP